MWHTVGGDRLTVDPLRSCGPILECRRMGRPPPGVPPGDEAHDGAIRIFGVIKVLSDSLLFEIELLTTLRKLLSGDEGDPPNHQPPSIPPANLIKNSMHFHNARFHYLLNSSWPYPPHWTSSAAQCANWVCWRAAHACYRNCIGA